MRRKIFGKICGILALLAPFWQFLIRKIYILIGFSSDIYILLCISSVILCFIALIASVIIDIKSFKAEEQVSSRNKLLIYGAMVLGAIMFLIVYSFLRR